MALWQDKLKSLIQDPGRRTDHVTETWAALLETKENRITVLERDVSLLEKELLQQQQLMQQQREQYMSQLQEQQQHHQQQLQQQHQQQLVRTSNPATPVPTARTTTPSVLQTSQSAGGGAGHQSFRNSPITNGQAGITSAANKEVVSFLLCL